MATTSPDNIRTPNPSDPYNLVADLAVTASDVQTALVRRANLYTGTSTQRIAFTTAPEGVHWQDTDGIKMIWRKDGAVWVPAVMRWSGTTAQMNTLTSAPDGFEWYSTSNNSKYIRLGGSWSPTSQSGTVTLPAINGNTLGSTINVVFPTPFPVTPRYVQLNCTGFRIKLNWNFLTTTGMSVYPANLWGTTSPAGETVEWRVTL